MNACSKSLHFHRHDIEYCKEAMQTFREFILCDMCIKTLIYQIDSLSLGSGMPLFADSDISLDRLTSGTKCLTSGGVLKTNTLAILRFWWSVSSLFTCMHPDVCWKSPQMFFMLHNSKIKAVLYF